MLDNWLRKLKISEHSTENTCQKLHTKTIWKKAIDVAHRNDWIDCAKNDDSDWWLIAKEFRQCKAVAKHKTFSVFMLT